jgi:hypothetical protein
VAQAGGIRFGQLGCGSGRASLSKSSYVIAVKRIDYLNFGHLASRLDRV